MVALHAGLNFALLKDILEEGALLVAELRRSEEELRELIIGGQHQLIAATEYYRSALQQRISAFEERRAALFPGRERLRSLIEDSEQEDEKIYFLSRLDEIGDNLQQIVALQEVNRLLIRERLRMIGETKELLFPPAESYNEKGLFRQAGSEALKLDRDC